MSNQPALDFGKVLAPSIIIGEAGSSEDYPPGGSVPVHSRADSIPGHGRHVITCERCGRTRRVKYKDAKFCSDACRYAHRHEKQGHVEAGKKKRAMRGSAALNAGYLRIARDAARRVLARDGDSDADRVRLLLDSEGTELSHWSGWSGSIFHGDPDYKWEAIGWVKAKHKGSKCRPIRVWR